MNLQHDALDHRKAKTAPGSAVPVSSVVGGAADDQSVSITSATNDRPVPVASLACPVCARPVHRAIESIAACSRCRDALGQLIDYVRDIEIWSTLLDQYLSGTDRDLSNVSIDERADIALFMSECKKLGWGIDMFTITEPMLYEARREPGSYWQLHRTDGVSSAGDVGGDPQ